MHVHFFAQRVERMLQLHNFDSWSICRLYRPEENEEFFGSPPQWSMRNSLVAHHSGVCQNLSDKIQSPSEYQECLEEKGQEVACFR
jgi:hypothetical protein